jgi:hypothetical protein
MNKFDSTFDYSFSCKMTEKVATPALGLHSWVGPDSAAQSAKDECEFTKSAHVYDDRGANCKWTETVPAGETEEDRSPEQGQPVSQSQQDTLKAHESAGEGYFESATQYLGQVVICISPSRTSTKLPGAWSTQNGYNGGVMGSGATASSPGCNTEWFNGGATTGVSNLNSGRHSVVTVPVV